MYNFMNFSRLFFSFLIILSLAGCGSDNSATNESSGSTTIETNATASISIVLPKSDITVDENNEELNVTVYAYDNLNNPLTSGKIKIVYPNKVQSGTDVGQFSPLEADISNGVATFTYKAPADLQSLVDHNDVNSTFYFYPDGNISNTKSFTIHYSPKANQVVNHTYTLSLEESTGEVTMPLQSSKLFTLKLTDSLGTLLSDSDVTSLTITSLNAGIASFENGSSTVSTITDDAASLTLRVKSNTKSGVVPLSVTAVFKNSNGLTTTLEKTFNIVVLSGSPTAISLSYAGTSQDADNAKFVEKWVVAVTDRYNNPVNTTPAISMGMIAGYASTNNNPLDPASWLYVKSTDVSAGTIANGSPDTFSINTAKFDYVDSANDVLTLFGSGYTYNASGKWDFTKGSNTLLNLQDDYAGITTGSLGYAIGHNYRQDQCRDSEEWIGNVTPENGSYTLSEAGTLRLNVTYDYYLTGKNVVLWVNLIGQQNSEGTTVRIGEAKKVPLRGQELEGAYAVDFPASFNGTVRIPIHITNTPERYRNANFSYKVIIGDTATINSISTSMANGIGSCTNNGVAYVDITLNANGEAGSVSLSDVLVATEF